MAYVIEVGLHGGYGHGSNDGLMSTSVFGRGECVEMDLGERGGDDIGTKPCRSLSQDLIEGGERCVFFLLRERLVLWSRHV